MTPPRPGGRPRSAQADQAIVNAVLDMLAEGSTIEALSMDAVAGRAGVGKATIYRRWPNKETLVMNAIKSLKGEMPVPAGRSVREDLIMLLTGTAHAARDSRASRILPCLAPEINRNPALYELYVGWMDQRRDVTRNVLRRGIETGELRPDTEVELVMAMLTSPMVQRYSFNWLPRLETDRLPERLVDTILAGVAAHPAETPHPEEKPAGD